MGSNSVQIGKMKTVVVYYYYYLFLYESLLFIPVMVTKAACSLFLGASSRPQLPTVLTGTKGKI